MSSDTPPGWVVPMMRAGYTARAITYLAVGGLGVAAAMSGGSAEGTTGAMAQLRNEPFGLLLLWVVALGLACYAVWRFCAAWYDLERRGDDGEGLFARAGLLLTGAIHLALGISVAGIAMGGGDGGDGGAAQDWTAKLLQMEGGRWIVGAVALGTMAAGAYYVWKGIDEKYKRTMRVTPTTRKLDPALRFGFVAQGTVIAIIGLLIGYAALRVDPSQAGGVGAALDYVRSMSFGRILLGLLSVGLLAFALENAVEAVYRIVPRCAGPDVDTLKSWAKRKAREAEAQAKAAG
ncbi:DUF1206 domain-containing protein [Litorisediminicola beolgyonensis]|uniref:DUF1206 domain-containing protein n=1 Tax=Litorisediminicola beolgyonensis TaxID=1173614 RepID=A0ABW3ZGR6_9RHOB